MSPLASAIYEILRRRANLSEPRITYKELAQQLREQSEEFEAIYQRSQALYVALGEVGRACRGLRLPSLPALVVRADTRRPGEAYFAGKCSGAVFRGEKIAAWRKEVDAIKRSKYPRLQTRRGGSR
jgi:hypothetical protein